MNRLKTSLGKLSFNNPITVASGTFGIDYQQFYNLNLLGAIVTKTITPELKKGNPTPRVYETECGMLNSIGLQNPGIDEFIKTTVQDYKHFTNPLIVSFSASTIDEFCEMLLKLEAIDFIKGYEVNVSCPNVENEGLAFGVDEKIVYQLTKKLSELTKKELIIKLSPNVTDIVSIAKAAEEGGASSVALINTLLGMAIDWKTGKSMIRRGVAGYSGVGVKPVALQMVYRVHQAISIPILAMGGIQNYQDCLEFIYAGASMLAIGTSQFSDPTLPITIINDLKDHFDSNKITIDEIKGKVWGIA
ncbi:MAG TPA: dihydroorotate dehydrogenase [Candidatus Cloacimonadota bacterium]|jgi:dihydroorotate dehydrogenase (NAD+) catalytic subunit|nr:dihydroorotate dehydrogenase [Candidatus Cloacimonadales bacterium]HPY96391.1 dihydroorotate dehydrogenase [Candidatus Cloacimonadota bacterium]HQB40684.1 dihydroorotate dehydrogenase [Candidatus Cloacimonadota bacterium]